jgi:hypothetical protein
MASSKIVCVLSPPRSGSSLTASVMNILGVHLGETRDFEQANEHNPKGYWEHQAIQEINDEILSRLGYDYSHAGADWTEPPVFPDNWETNPQLSDLRERAQDFVHRNFSEHDVWGWKDPRTCLTLPFWKRILPRIEYVILIRNPVDVARSLERFINIDCSFERGLYMWVLYLNYAFKHTAGQNRILVNVESWTDDWKGELSRLACFIGNPGLADNTSIQDAVHGLVDKSLWHHRSSSRALLTVHRLYEQVYAQDGVLEQDSFTAGQETLDLLAAEALRSDADKTLRDKEQWRRQLAQAFDELADLIPLGSNLVLVEDNQIGTDVVKDRSVKPFMERNGEYGGCPDDSSVAIEEFRRLHAAGAEYIAFAWPAHWWLDHFSEFHDHLRLNFRCILQNERMIIFDLQR